MRLINNLKNFVWNANETNTPAADDNLKLHLAIEEKADLTTIKTIIENNPELLFEKDRLFGRTPIHLAVLKERNDVLLLLINAANTDKNYLNSFDKNGNTPLNLAARDGMIAAVTILLENGADKYQASTISFNKRPLVSALHSTKPNKKAVVAELLKYETEPQNEEEKRLLSTYLAENHDVKAQYQNFMIENCLAEIAPTKRDETNLIAMESMQDWVFYSNEATSSDEEEWEKVPNSLINESNNHDMKTESVMKNFDVTACLPEFENCQADHFA